MNRHWGRVCASAAALIVAGSAAGGASAQPDSDGLKLKLGYDGRLLFLKVLNVDLIEHVTPSGHASSARISSYGILDAFKHFNIDATESGRIVRGDPQPGVFKHENHDGKRNRKVEVIWGGEDVATAAQPEMTFLGDPPATRQQRLESVGYLTAVMRMTIAADAGPCHGSERIFNGKELSELGFADPRPVDLSSGQKRLGLVNGTRCNATFREVAGYKKKKGKDQNQGLDRPIQVDFAQVGRDGPWVTAKLQAHTQLGEAVIELARIDKQGRLPEGIVQASR
jgi:hypothetical protein